MFQNQAIKKNRALTNRFVIFVRPRTSYKIFVISLFLLQNNNEKKKNKGRTTTEKNPSLLHSYRITKKNGKFAA